MKSAVVFAAAAFAIAFGASASQASVPAQIVFAADRAPTVTGEIYRVLPNGRRVDLSKSPYQDTNPAVSPDGTRVAFISDRAGGAGVYEVGIDGTGLVAVARRVPQLNQTDGRTGLAWQPNGSLLAVSSDAAVSILERGLKTVTIRGTNFGASQPWSPDGNVLLLFQPNSHEVRAVSPDGHTLWTHGADWISSPWSAIGLIAVPRTHGVAVYDEVGQAHFKLHLPTTPAAIAWSADGRRLAVLWESAGHYNLEVTTETGMRLLEERAPGGSLGWMRDTSVVIGFSSIVCPGCKAHSVNVRTGKISPSSSRWLEPRTADGKLAMVTSSSGAGFAVGVAPLGADAKKKAEIDGCFSDGVWLPAMSFPQFAGRSIVYENWNLCDPPFANLYSVSGARIHRLTKAEAQETQPALSPDATEIAYVWAAYTGLSCKGCSDGIRIASASGALVRTVTDPPDCTFDDSPSWSPDGTTILYSETGCDSPGELFTIPAAGGTPHDLGVAGTDPTWGTTRIAYSAGGVWTANPDGSSPTLVASNGKYPAWSATGVLAYSDGRRSLVVGSNPPVKLPFAAADLQAWTADGTRLVVLASQTSHGAPDLYSVKPDGTGPIRLTKNYFG